MGMSTDKNALEFPYIESEEYIHALDNVVISDAKEITFKKGTLDEEEVGKIRLRGAQGNLGLQTIVDKLDSGQLTDREAIRALIDKIDSHKQLLN